MFDRSLVCTILMQVDEALEKIASRSGPVQSADDFTSSAGGMEKLDSICMQFMAIGEALKNIDKISGGTLFVRYPGIDWKGAMGFRDIIAHRYFDIDAEQVFWICAYEVGPLASVVKAILQDLQQEECDD